MLIVLMTKFFAMPASAADIDSVSADCDGENITVSFRGVSWYVQQDLTFQYGSSNSETYILIVGDEGVKVKTTGWGDVPEIQGTLTAPKPNYQAEINIPVSFLKSTDVTVSMNGISLSAEELGLTGGSPEPSPEPTPEPSAGPTDSSAYKGIVIDGNFSDWDAVPKFDIDEKKDWDTVDQLAMVWDGDWVYLYFATNSWDYGAVTGAGPNNNGQFAITTDLGNTLLIQLVRGGSVNGVSGASVATDTKSPWEEGPHYWEVAVPGSLLPSYLKTINFGPYLGETVITDVANFQGTEQKEFFGITYDGEYDDWENYPHTTIEYATAGTHEHVVDSEGALYADDGYLYGHVISTMPAHQNLTDFTHGITILLGDDASKSPRFYPRYITLNGDGSINWYPDFSHVDPGTTIEYCIVDQNGWSNAMTLEELEACGNALYGRAYVTVDGSSVQTEFRCDISKLAEHAGFSAEDIKTLKAQYGRLGQQWIITAGTSTAPALGVGICIAVVGGVLAVERRKKKCEEKE